MKYESRRLEAEQRLAAINGCSWSVFGDPAEG
jgi:hypothetical protein